MRANVILKVQSSAKGRHNFYLYFIVEVHV